MSESEYPIKQVALEIYGGCNYKCQMCPQAEGRHHDFLKKIPPEVFSKVVKEAGEHGCEMVSLHGSGEATLHPQMAEYVKLVKDHGMQCITVTNGFRLNERLSRDLITAGLDIIRVSAIGYDRETYLEWMKKDAFELVRENVIKYREIAEQEGGKAKIKLYSLILDPNELEKEVEMYKKNWVEYCDVEAEIWTMHNWSGVYTDTPYERSAKTRRSCGRPNAPYLNVRAGGLNGQTAAVVPCCFVLGQDEKRCSAISTPNPSMRFLAARPMRRFARPTQKNGSMILIIAPIATSSMTCRKRWYGQTFPEKPTASRRFCRISTTVSGTTERGRQMLRPR